MCANDRSISSPRLRISAFPFIQGHVVREVGGVSVTLKAVVYSENTEGEGHHLMIADNFVHGMLGERVLDLRGSNFNVITGNSFGRVSGALAVIDLTSSSSPTAGPAATTISSNDFHNVGLAPGVRINGGASHTISANQFTLSSYRSIEIGDSATTERTQITGNQFVPIKGSIGSEPAVSIQGGVRHAIQANTFYDYSASAILIQGVAAGDFAVESNFER